MVLQQENVDSYEQCMCIRGIVEHNIEHSHHGCLFGMEKWRRSNKGILDKAYRKYDNKKAQVNAEINVMLPVKSVWNVDKRLFYSGFTVCMPYSFVCVSDCTYNADMQGRIIAFYRSIVTHQDLQMIGEWSVDEKIDWMIYSGVFEYFGDNCDNIAGIDMVCNREDIRLGFVCCVDRLKSEVWGSVESIFEYNAVNTFEVRFCISKNQPKIKWIGMIPCYIGSNAKNRSSLVDDWRFRLADD